MQIDIKQRLREYAHPSSLVPLEPSVPLVLDALAEIQAQDEELAAIRSLLVRFDAESPVVMVGRAVAEIERLENEVAAERHARGRERQEHDAVSRSMIAQLVRMTDAVLRAGITEALGD
jgi:hypothetical protein